MRSAHWASLIFVGSTIAAIAQVPVSKDPAHKVTFENAQFRVIDVNIPAGQTSLEHKHDLDIATVSMTNGPETRIQVSGQPWGAANRRALGNSRVTEYVGKPLTHRIEN